MQTLSEALPKLTNSPASTAFRLPQKAYVAPALRESPEAQTRLDSLLLGCFSVQKLYGRDAGNIEAVAGVFHATLANYPADKVVRAFETWIGRSQEFPTPADIVGLVNRNGRPPIAEAEFVAVNRKDGADRTPEEWQLLKDWERERRGWEETPERQANMQAENVRLREEVASLRAETRRLADLLRKAESAVVPHAEIDLPTRVQNTVDAMREAGAPEQDIAEFISQQAA